ncbi:NRPS-like enzyme [Penicillium alfredii]|uniref:NRPS-like enzyme n=1 Tax=Penicillium alfredii TaxID=1506179 RepID=A0A9W9F1W3_9EURO|nr:NRPS-like enzyme [Penicillium alfredii]KAJ5091915.1 NRPS-like enzyme [Penicillium alfredii]
MTTSKPSSETNSLTQTRLWFLYWIGDWLKYRILIVYRKLFSVIWFANLAVLIVLLSIPSINRAWLTTVALANLIIAIVIRQDFIINLIFAYCCSIPKSWPFAIRRRIAKVYYLGSIHSGCAIAAVCWFVASFALSLRGLIKRQSSSTLPVPTIVLSSIALLLLAGMIAASYPALRKRYHNTFECVYRFSG